jgi:hypothetical protein
MLEASSAFLNETSFLFRGSVTTYTTCLICSLTSQRVLAMPIPTSSSSSNDPPIPLHSLFDAMLTPVLLDGVDKYDCISCAPARQTANQSFRLR